MSDSPRLRRLRSDLRVLEQLRRESSILTFTALGDPPELYHLRFAGRGVWRPQGASEVCLREQHEIWIKLGAGYPRLVPELAWRTPVFHPNVSASGVICLGGYGTHWAPAVQLDELCVMLWDMCRYQNFDVNSPYNREAAVWAKTQVLLPFPLDPRPLRDRVARGETGPAWRRSEPEVRFLDPSREIVEAELAAARAAPAAEEIVFLS